MRPKIRKRLLDRGGNKCAHCGATDNLQIDHIIPVCRNGREDEDNMQVLCQSCNYKKGRGIDLEPYLKIGVNPAFILIRKDFPIGSVSPAEGVAYLQWAFRENKATFAQAGGK